MTLLDLARLRRHTPGCESVIHFNNAGAALMPDPVFNAVTTHLALERHRGGYEAEAAAKPAIEDFYDAFAQLLGCAREEIAYVENATRAWDMAVYALPLEQGDRVLVHESDYASNYLAMPDGAASKSTWCPRMGPVRLTSQQSPRTSRREHG